MRVLQVALLHQVCLDFGRLVANREEVVGVPFLDVELLANSADRPRRCRRTTTVTDVTVGPLARLTPRRGLAAEADVVLEVQAIAGVALPDAAGLEPPRDVVLGDPDLIVAVGEIRRVDELQLVGEVLPQRQPRARIGFAGDERRLDADLAETGGLSADRGRASIPTRPARYDSTCSCATSNSSPRMSSSVRPVTSMAMMSGSGRVGSDVSVVCVSPGVPVTAILMS